MCKSIAMIQNLKDVFNQFKDEATCREFLVQQRWNGSPVCPYCGHTKAYNIEHGKRFKCASSACYKKFSVTVGTIFEASNIPLTTWFPAMYIITAHKKGISSVQLAKDLGVTQKTAWFILHRIREALKAKNSPLFSGIVESDETYMARKYRSDYKGLPPEQVEYLQKNKLTTKNKGAVLGIASRDTKTIHVTAFDANNAENIRGEIKKRVEAGSTLMTDESFLYRRGLEEYKKESVFHSKEEWVRKEANYKVHTNRVENFWSVMKRGVYGIYHQISFKHLQAYCNEFSYRYNSRDLKDGARFYLTLNNIEGRLTYKALIGNGRKEGNEETTKS